MVLLGERGLAICRPRSHSEDDDILLGEDGDDYSQPQYWVYKVVLYNIIGVNTYDVIFDMRIRSTLDDDKIATLPFRDTGRFE